MTNIRQHLLHIWITEIDVAFLVWSAIFIAAVDAEASCKLSEFHDVASESASLVGEDVFYLAELLV